MQEHPRLPEFSRIVEIVKLPPLGESRSIAAEPEERSLIAQRLELVAVHELSARIDLEPWRGSGWRVRSTVSADIEQQCVVTAEEFRTPIKFEFERCFMKANDRSGVDKELIIDPSSDDEPDLIFNGEIDIGDLTVEALALSLDPYPRMPGAKFEDSDTVGDEDEAEAKISPFAVLGKLGQSE